MAEVVVTADGSTVEASLGDSIVVRLPENATTGYQWVISNVDPPLALDSNEIEVPDPLLRGARSTRVVRLHPTGPGRARISMHLKRHWEQNPVDGFNAEIVIV